MTTQEFTNEFDVFYNNVASNAAPGLNEYEKSVFLTKAQSELVKAYFISSTNKSGSGFDGDEKRQYDFSALLRVANLFDINSAVERVSSEEKIDRRSKVYLFPQDYFISVNELLSDNDQFYSVQPITYTDYQRMMTKPYPYPPKRVAWRLITDKKTCDSFQAATSDGTGTFSMATGWTDRKIPLAITFALIGNTSITVDSTKGEEYVDGNTIIMNFSDLRSNVKVQIENSLDSNNYYNINFTVTIGLAVTSINLESYIKIIQDAFEFYYKFTGKKPSLESTSNNIEKAYVYTDGLKNYSITGHPSVSSLTYPLKSTTVNIPMAEIIGKFSSSLQYQMRYIKRPKPIILGDLGEVTIEGLSKVTECELPEELHPEILQRAVELAKAAYLGDLNSTISVGNASATNLGVIASNK